MLVGIDWRGASMVMIESDSRVAVSWVLRKESRPWRWFHFIDEACMSLPNVCFHNVIREANGIVDVLAKNGVDRRSWLRVM
ncbi:hypothetical protein GQ457_08G019150 [Hibiscus cannabinus]